MAATVLPTIHLLSYAPSCPDAAALQAQRPLRSISSDSDAPRRPAIGDALQLAPPPPPSTAATTPSLPNVAAACALGLVASLTCILGFAKPGLACATMECPMAVGLT